MEVKWLPPIKTQQQLRVKNHSAVYYSGFIYIFGGYDGSRNHDALYSFNVATQELTLINATGTLPKRRNGHSATLVGTMLFIFHRLYRFRDWRLARIWTPGSTRHLPSQLRNTRMVSACTFWRRSRCM